MNLKKDCWLSSYKGIIMHFGFLFYNFHSTCSFTKITANTISLYNMPGFMLCTQDQTSPCFWVESHAITGKTRRKKIFDKTIRLQQNYLPFLLSVLTTTEVLLVRNHLLTPQKHVCASSYSSLHTLKFFIFSHFGGKTLPACLFI